MERSMSMTTTAKARAALLVAVVALLSLAALLAAEPAHGGTYGAAICNPDLRAWSADVSFLRTSPHYTAAADCGRGGNGLSVTHRATATGGGAWGAWIVRAPAGTSITQLNVSASGGGAGGHTPELLRAAPGSSLIPFATPARGLRRFKWGGGELKEFAARLRCRRASRCTRGRDAAVHMKRVALRLIDPVTPSLRLAGGLFASGSRRGVQAVEPAASDVGGGVRRFLLQVNGQPVTSHTVGCQLAGAIARRLRPCPSQAVASFAAATQSAPFRQGPNLVRICAADYAATTAANRACADRRVRIDNLCPISPVAGGASLRAHLRRRRDGATVTGRLLGRGGDGIAGARVCVGGRVRLDAAVERVLATPVTAADGRFRAQLPKGPSREVRVAYWPTDASVLERYLDLRVRAHPGLTVRPARPLRNGDRAHFKVRLPGPAAGHRDLRLQVHSRHRWLELRAGRTNPRGIYRARYRFHATTGRRTYAFRAVLRKQAGYPYESGHSKVRRVTVVG
jgi:hypothetical protein